MTKEEKGSTLYLLVFFILCAVTVLGLGLSSVKADVETITPTVEVGNSPPSPGSITLDGGTDITLTEGSTTTVACTVRITDSNGYTDIATPTAKIYRSDLGIDCVEDDNNCYTVGSTTEDTTEVCTESATSSNYIDYSCAAFLWFFADSTDASSTNYNTENWECDIIAWDNQEASATDVVSQFAIQLDSTIDYGNLSSNETSTVQTTRATSTGNEIIDLNIYGEAMATSSFTIAVGQQEWSSSTFNHGEGVALTDQTSNDYKFDLPKPTSADMSSTTIYWAIQIPGSQDPGIYVGTNTISAVSELP